MTVRKIASTLSSARSGAADRHCAHSNGEIERLVTENTILRLLERKL
jgi:hypothetical protein